jgi:hypothetical protein
MVFILILERLMSISNDFDTETYGRKRKCSDSKNLSTRIWQSDETRFIIADIERLIKKV